MLASKYADDVGAPCPSVANPAASRLKNFERAVRRARKRLVCLLTGAQPAITNYSEWIGSFDRLSKTDREIIRQNIASYVNPPHLSVLLPAYNPQSHWLDLSIRSVRAQIYPHWELCIVCDGSIDSRGRRILSRHAEEDGRIKVVYRTECGHASRLANSALELATGDYFALLGAGDLLAEHALFWVVEAIQQNPDAKLIYSDEDNITANGKRKDPSFKCDWNPFLFFGYNMIGHLGVFDTSLVRHLGGLSLIHI